MLKTTLAAAAIATVAALAGPAAAEARSLRGADHAVQTDARVTTVDWRGDRHRPRHGARGHHSRLHRGQIVRRLAWRGYYGFSSIRARGDIYRVDAIAPRGFRVRLVVDAYSGKVLNRHRIGRGWHARGQWGHRW